MEPLPPPALPPRSQPQPLQPEEVRGATVDITQLTGPTDTNAETVPKELNLRPLPDRAGISEATTPASNKEVAKVKRVSSALQWVQKHKTLISLLAVGAGLCIGLAAVGLIVCCALVGGPPSLLLAGVVLALLFTSIAVCAAAPLVPFALEKLLEYEGPMTQKTLQYASDREGEFKGSESVDHLNFRETSDSLSDYQYEHEDIDESEVDDDWEPLKRRSSRSLEEEVPEALGAIQKLNEEESRHLNEGLVSGLIRRVAHVSDRLRNYVMS